MSPDHRFRVFLLAACCALTGSAMAETSPEDDLFAPNWDRELALQTARFGTDEQQLQNWFALLRQGEAATLFRSLQNFSTAGVIASPAREKQLYRFTLALSDFPHEAIPEEVLDFLERYPAKTLVPHEEHAGTGVPLFNIAAAARGVRHAGLRDAGRQEAEALVAQPPRQWLEAYLSGDASTRRGFLDQLDMARRQELEALGYTALGLMPRHAALTAVAGAAALSLNDLPALEFIAVEGHGPDLAPIFRRAAGQWPEAERSALLRSAIDHAPAVNAALAIALLAPGLSGNETVTQTLFALLDHPELGSTAALALARHPSVAVASELQRLAGTDGEAARRVRMALEMAGTAVPGSGQ